MSSKFYMPTRLFSGEKCIEKNSAEIVKLGKRCIIVTGRRSAKSSGALNDLLNVLNENNIQYVIFDEVEQNPLVSSCYRAGRLAIDSKAEFVVGIGGGSPLDAAKAVAVYASNPKLSEYGLFEGWENRALPIVLIGTTAGTGSEVTPYSVLTRDDTGQKGSFNGSDCYATIAYGDPLHTKSLPKHFTISTALDAISHCVESYFVKTADVISENFAIEGLRLGLETLNEIKDFSIITIEQREKLYIASIYGGLAINTTGTALCHLLSYPLSEEKDVSHGYACSIFLPEFIKLEAENNKEKAQRLFKSIGTTQNALCELLEGYNKYQLPINCDEKDLGRWMERWSVNQNITKTTVSYNPKLIKETVVRALDKINKANV